MNSHVSQSGRRGRRDPGKERLWRQTLGQFAASGQSVRAFCAQRHLKETAFHFWRREIARRDGEVVRKHPAGVDVGTAGPSAPRPRAFAQVLVRPPRSPGQVLSAASPPELNVSTLTQESLWLALSGGRELLLLASLAAEQVAAMVRAIEEAL